MKKSVIILEKVIDTDDYKKIDEYLNPIQKNIVAKYGFVFKTEEDRNTFFRESFQELYVQYKEEKSASINSGVKNKNLWFESFYKKNILNKLKEFIKSYDEKDIYNITKYLIDFRIGDCNIEDVESCIKNLERIDVFFLTMKITPTSSLIEKILHNEKIYERVAGLINSFSDNGVIEYDKVYGMSQGIITSMLLELYCKEKCIKIDESTKILEKSFLTSNKFSDYSNLDALDMYLKDVYNSPLLSPLEEILAFKEYHEGNKNVRNKLIESNLRLVVSVARKYQNTGVELLDLIQYGNLGLYNAIDKYDFGSGYKFSTYATMWIKQSITRNVESECSSIIVPIWVKDSVRKYNRAVIELGSELGRKPEMAEIAEYLDWTIEKTMMVLESVPNVLSIDQKVDESTDSDEIGFFISSDVSVEDDVIDDVTKTELTDKIFDVFDKIKLTDREREVILLRFGFITGKEETLEVVAQNLNVTRERVRQIEAKALKKMRLSRSRKELAYYLDDPEWALKNLQNNYVAIQKGIKRLDSDQSTPKVKKKTYSAPSVKAKPVSENNIVTVINGDTKTSYRTSSASKSNVMSSSEKEKFLSSCGSFEFKKDNTFGNAVKGLSGKTTDTNAGASFVDASIGTGGSSNINIDAIHNIDDKVVTGKALQQVEETCMVDATEPLTSSVPKNNDFNRNDNIVENQGSDSDSSNVQPVKRRRFSPKGMISLKETFSLVDEEILNKIVTELTEEQQKIVEKRGVTPLDDSERGVYYAIIIPKVKRRIAREVAHGNVDEKVLTEYNIQPDRSDKRKTRRSSSENSTSNYGKTLSETFDKVDKSILDKIVSTFSEEQQRIVEKREVYRLDDAERLMYFNSIIPKVKRRIATEVALGNLPNEILEIYNIKPDYTTLKALEKSKMPVVEKTKKHGMTLRQAFSKVDDEVFDRLISELTVEEQEIVKKRETGSKLSLLEKNRYFGAIIPKIKRRIAKEVFLGNLPSEILDEYKIDAITQVQEQTNEKKPKRVIQGLTLKQYFSKIDGNLLDAMILELSEEQQAVVRKREAGIKLTPKEKNVYFGSVFYNIKTKIALEVHHGKISEDVLAVYSIKPYGSNKVAPENKKYNLTLHEKYSKIDGQILDLIISRLPKKYIDIINKRETSGFTSKEKSTYYSTILPKIQAEIAKEGGRGAIPLDVLDEYNIKPVFEDKTNVASSEDSDVMVVKISNPTGKCNNGISFCSNPKNEISLEKKEKLLKDNENMVAEKNKLFIRKKPEEMVDVVGTSQNRARYVSLRKRFSDVDSNILEQIISELPKDKRKIIDIRENRKLTSTENKIYGVITTYVRRRLAEEVFLGNLSSDVLEDHNIAPVTRVRKRRKIVEALEKEESEEKEEPNEYDILKLKLLTIVANQKTEELDKLESVFYDIFDPSYLTSDLNPKMFSYINMRFGYLDGNNYSKETISRVLSDEDIEACHQNILLYIKYEVSRVVDDLSIGNYQKTIGKKHDS